MGRAPGRGWPSRPGAAAPAAGSRCTRPTCPRRRCGTRSSRSELPAGDARTNGTVDGAGARTSGWRGRGTSLLPRRPARRRYWAPRSVFFDRPAAWAAWTRARALRDLGVEPRDLLVQEVEVGQLRREQEALVGADAPA